MFLRKMDKNKYSLLSGTVSIKWTNYAELDAFNTLDMNIFLTKINLVYLFPFKVFFLWKKLNEW